MGLQINTLIIFFCHGSTALIDPNFFIVGGSRLRSITYATPVRAPPDESVVRRRDPYLTTHNTFKRLTSYPPA